MPASTRALLLTLSHAAMVAAAPHLPILHREPAITIRAIAECPDGLFRLAAADGLYRFDGSHFEKVREFPFASARFVSCDSNGVLWIAGEEGLARWDKRFTVVMRSEIQGMAAGPGWLLVNPGIVTRVEPDGVSHALPGAFARRDLLRDDRGQVWHGCGFQLLCTSSPLIDERRTYRLPDESADEVFIADEGFQDRTGRIWAANDRQAGLVEDGRMNLMFHREPARSWRPGPLLPGRNGQLWLLGETIVGVNPPVQFRNPDSLNRFQATAGYEDARGHLWVALAGLGIVEWLPDAGWERWFTDDFARQPVTQVVQARNGPLVAATGSGLYRLGPTGKWEAMPGKRQRCDSLLALEDGGFLASIRGAGLVRLTSSGSIVERLPVPAWPAKDQSATAILNNYRGVFRDRLGRIWAGHKQSLMRVEGRPGSLRPRLKELPGGRPASPGHEYLPNAVDLEVDSRGRLWAGYEEGLAWLDEDDHWHPLPTDRPIRQVRSFAMAGNRQGDEIWVCYRHAGPFSRLSRQGDTWAVTDFTPEAGYGPQDTHFIKCDSRGWIWRGSTDGVHVTDGAKFTPNDWIHIGPDNGLATSHTSQYGFFEDGDRTVWIGGDEGVSHLSPRPEWFEAPHDAPAPRVSRAEIDGHPVSLTSGAAIPKSSLLRIEVTTFGTPLFRDYPLRYRLLPTRGDWSLSRDGTFEFRNLPAQTYTLEVQYTGNGSSHGMPAKFQVGAVAISAFYCWILAVSVSAGVLGFALRGSSVVERVRYGFAKDLFLLRRYLGPAPLQSSDPVGTAFRDLSGVTVGDRYRLTMPVGQGGSSVVYDARDGGNGDARVAVKLLHLDEGTPASVRNRFAQEVAALRSIQHPGIVPILDSWIGPGGEPCLAMAFLDGPTLRTVLSDGPLPARRVARLIRQLGTALAEVHRRGIVHRDLKPENVILVQAGQEDEQAVIIDFGTAGFRGPDRDLATTTQLSGSFYYMAPERLAKRFSSASDVYAFAVIVLEMLTGRRLADLNSMFGEPAFLEELQQSLAAAASPEVAKIARTLACGYAPEPKDRPSDVAAWAEEIAELLDGGLRSN